VIEVSWPQAYYKITFLGVAHRHFLPNDLCPQKYRSLVFIQKHQAAEHPSWMFCSGSCCKCPLKLCPLFPTHVCLQPKVPVANWLTTSNWSQWNLFRVWASSSIRTLSPLLLSLSCNMIRSMLLIIFISFGPSPCSAWRDPRSSHHTPPSKFSPVYHSELWSLFIWSWMVLQPVITSLTFRNLASYI
jgi:hypothetical protein